MRKTRDIILAAGAALALATFFFGQAFATDFTALREDPRVHHELLGASVAYLIDEKCSELDLRRLRLGIRALNLRTYARGLGFDNREIATYVDSPVEQARFRAIAEPMLAEKGAVIGNGESFCTVGYAEIKKNTFIGGLLRRR